jgi:hypothetical protein
MIVLLQEGADSIVVTLTTSKDKVPTFHQRKRCVVDTANGVHFYFMPQGPTRSVKMALLFQKTPGYNSIKT